jgi:chromosome segregation ATPase
LREEIAATEERIALLTSANTESESRLSELQRAHDSLQEQNAQMTREIESLNATSLSQSQHIFVY